jgi:hypothetical protein
MGQLDDFVKDVQVVVSDLKSPEEKSKRLAAFAKEQIAEAVQINETATGNPSPYQVAVDGRIGAPIDSVKPDGVIVATFDLIADTLNWIGEMLVKESPVLTGEYANSHVLFVDGVAHTPGDAVPDAEEYVFMNVQPYARKIEHGLSPQSPDGVYQAVAAVAKQRFGNTAKITFTYRGVVAGTPVNQALAASSGQPWWLGGAAQRAASGMTETKIAKDFGKTAHNKSDVRYPALIVVPR